METTTEPHDIAQLCAQLAAITDQLVAPGRQDQQQTTIHAIGEILGSVDRLTAAIVGLLQQLTHRGVIAAEGVTTGTWLRVFAARTTADERMLQLAAEHLTQMPAVSAWFADGTMSWPTVRGILAATRNLTGEQRAWVDATIAEDRQRIARLDPDQIVAATERLADQARPDLHAAREQRRHERQYLTVQPRLDGTARLTADLDAEAAATVLAAFDAVDLDDDPPPDDHDGDDVGWRQRRGRTNAAKLVAIAQSHLGGGDPRRARPAMIVVTDVNALTGDQDLTSGTQLLWSLHTTPVELTPQAAQRLSCDATLRHVLVDGATVLGATAAHPKVSAALRAALIARDGGCRFPGCRAPAPRCDNHHLLPRGQGGPTVLDNLALLCNAHHHAVHDNAWTTHLHPDGTITFTRRGVTLTSTPRHHQRLHASGPPPPGRPRRRRQPPAHTTPAPPEHHDATTSRPATHPAPLPF